MSESKRINSKEIRDLREYVKQVSDEVKGWPEWKKAFACDVYSLPRSALDGKPEQGRPEEV